MDNDVEVGGVPIGPTEIVTLGTMVSAVLVLIFHKDWGLAAHIQTLAAQALIILPIVLGLLRSFKHHLATKVTVAKIAATPPPVAVGTVVMNSSPNSGSAGGGTTVTTTIPGSTTYTGTGGAGGGATVTVSQEPDPNLGTDVTSVDVDSLPEDIEPTSP